MATETANIGSELPPSKGLPPLKSKKMAKKTIGYMTLPGIVPQIKYISKSGFGYLAYLMAAVFQAVRILPSSHPYLNPENVGRYSFIKVIAAAADNIQVNRNNVDQMVVFGAIITAVLLLIIQFASLIFLVAGGGDAMAITVNQNMFITPAAQQDTDIAFSMLREVFGIPVLFGAHTITPFQAALHTLFEFYNYAILLVAVIVFLYYVMVVIGETAATGTPFGKRWSSIYAPIRLVVAVGLLVPLNYGFNGSQYLALYSAKLGSSLATNGWTMFNAATPLNPTGEDNRTYLAEPNTPESRGITEFMSIVNTCREIYATSAGIIITPHIIESATQAHPLGNAGYQAVIAANPTSDVRVVFGEEDPDHAGTFEASIKPYCGEVKIPTNLGDLPSLGLIGDASPARTQEYYMTIVWTLWDISPLVFIAQRFAWANDSDQLTNPCDAAPPGLNNGVTGPVGACGLPSTQPPAVYKDEVVATVHSLFQSEKMIRIMNARGALDLRVPTQVLELGWGGAGIWYNKIAHLNSAFLKAIIAVPEAVKYPMVMEDLKKEKLKAEDSTKDCKLFTPYTADGKAIKLKSVQDGHIAAALGANFEWWRCDKPELTGNFIWDAISALFGLEGLFRMRDNDGVHPLAKLAMLGNGLIESSVRNMGFAIAGGVIGGGVSSILNEHVGGSIIAAGSFFSSIATVGLSIGFILYYILPFLPFIYIFFAVGTWVKGIFEAMVGAPLWALAHLRIDGDGVPGKMAASGYFLILEIGLRPILTIFGLLGSFVIFTSMVDVLNATFTLVTENLTGTKIWDNADAVQQEFGRHIIDQFFYTILYTIVVYMMAISSFKLINLVPNNILRWIGANTSAFADNAKDPTEGLAQYAAIGGNQIGAKLGGGLGKLGEGVGGVAGLAGGNK